MAEPPIPANYGLKKIATNLGAPALALAAQGLELLPTQKFCMALAVYHEARGESPTGQLAVARVILNRVRSKAYPSTVCGVVFQGAEKPNRCQFSFACDELADAPRNLSAFARLLELSEAVLDRGLTDQLKPCDPREYRDSDFDQITHYHAAYVHPYWAGKIKRIGQIGQHVFYRSARVARTL